MSTSDALPYPRSVLSPGAGGMARFEFRGRPRVRAFVRNPRSLKDAARAFERWLATSCPKNPQGETRGESDLSPKYRTPGNKKNTLKPGRPGWASGKWAGNALCRCRRREQRGKEDRLQALERGLRVLSEGNRLKSRSIVQSSSTPCRRQMAATRASWTLGPEMRPLSRRSRSPGQ